MKMKAGFINNYMLADVYSLLQRTIFHTVHCRSAKIVGTVHTEVRQQPNAVFVCVHLFKATDADIFAWQKLAAEFRCHLFLHCACATINSKDNRGNLLHSFKSGVTRMHSLSVFIFGEKYHEETEFESLDLSNGIKTH